MTSSRESSQYRGCRKYETSVSLAGTQSQHYEENNLVTSTALLKEH